VILLSESKGKLHSCFVCDICPASLIGFGSKPFYIKEVGRFLALVLVSSQRSFFSLGGPSF